MASGGWTALEEDGRVAKVLSRKALTSDDSRGITPGGEGSTGATGVGSRRGGEAGVAWRVEFLVWRLVDMAKSRTGVGFGSKM